MNTNPSRPLRSGAVAAAVLLLGVACGPSGGSSQWTYQPVLTTPSAVAGSPGTSPGGSPGASPGASPGTSPGGSPMESVSPAPTAGQSGSPGQTAGAPSGDPSIDPSPNVTAGDSPANAQIGIAAQNVAFDTDQLTAPANTPFQIVFENREDVPHNVSIYDTPQKGQTFFVGEWLNQAGTITYDIPALPAGTYTFLCDVHPVIMVGTLTTQ